MVIALVRSTRLSSPRLYLQTRIATRWRASTAIRRCYATRPAINTVTAETESARTDNSETSSATTSEGHASSLLAFASQTPEPEAYALNLKFLRFHYRKEQSAYHVQKHEADVGADKKLGTLIIDLPQHRNDAHAWADVIQFRYRFDGFRGVRQVWKGMRMRGFEPPTSGHSAQTIWSTIARSIIATKQSQARKAFANEVFQKAQDIMTSTGQTCASFHKVLIGQCFRVSLDRARDWHEELYQRGLVLPEALNDILVDVMLTRSQSFMHIPVYLGLTRSPGKHNVYDNIIKSAISLVPRDIALRWHQALLKRGDAPSRAMVQTAEVQELFKMNKDESLPVMKKTRLVPKVDELQLPEEFPVLTESYFSRLGGEAHGSKEKKISDNVVAKLLATRALSLDAVLRGIGILGVNNLNAVCVRELAIRCGTSKEYLRRAADLTSQKIKFASSNAFARLLSQFANTDREDLFQALLASDQHPDNWGEVKLQAALQKELLNEGRDLESQVTHAALMGSGLSGVKAAWNLQLRHGLKSRQWKLVERATDELQALRMPIGTTNISLLNRIMLPRRQPPRGPQESQRVDEPGYDATKFAAKAYVYADELGGNVPAFIWVELLKRMGHRQQWTALEKVLLHLAERRRQELKREELDPRHSSTAVMPAKWHVSSRMRQQQHPGAWRRSAMYTAVFDEQLIQALFAWGVRDAPFGKIPFADEDPLPEQCKSDDSWVRGLILLRRLKEEGIPLKIDWIRRAFVVRMWKLRQPNPAANNGDAAPPGEFGRTLKQLVLIANEIWNDELFPGVKANCAIEDDAIALALLAALRFRRGRQADAFYADAEKWLQDLAYANTSNQSSIGSVDGQSREQGTRSPDARYYRFSRLPRRRRIVHYRSSRQAPNRPDTRAA